MGRLLDFAHRGGRVEGGRWRSDLLDDDGDVHMPGGPCRHVKLCEGLTSLTLVLVLPVHSAWCILDSG